MVIGDTFGLKLIQVRYLCEMRKVRKTCQFLIKKLYLNSQHLHLLEVNTHPYYSPWCCHAAMVEGF